MTSPHIKKPPSSKTAEEVVDTSKIEEKIIYVERETPRWFSAFVPTPTVWIIIIVTAGVFVFILVTMLLRNYWTASSTGGNARSGGGAASSSTTEQTIDFVVNSSASTRTSPGALVALSETGGSVQNRSSLTIVRTRSDANADGSFILPADLGGTIVASSETGVHEVVVFRYPSYEIAHSESNVSEVVIDFLPPGEYTCFVFAIGNVADAKLTLRKRRPAAERPPTRIHRNTLETIAKTRETRIEGIAESLAKPGSRLIFTASSAPSQMWPRPLFMRVETLAAAVPVETTELFVVVPSYGYVVSGAAEHLGPVLHESANFAIYRCVARPHASAARGDFAFLQSRGGGGSSSSSERNSINIKVVYPDMSIGAQLSPKTRVFMFAPS